MRLKKNIPNYITSLNIICGLLAIISAFEYSLLISSYFIGFAVIFDFFDGTAARLLKAKSETGKELDSLADVISFGVAPGVILYRLILQSTNIPILSIYGVNIVPFISFLIPVFASWRLAKFNIDSRQTDSFLGLPTPATAIFIASLPVIIYLQFEENNLIHDLLAKILLNSWFLIFLSILLALLMIIEIPLFSLKFKNLNWKGNEIRFVFLLISIVLILLFYFIAIPIIILLYIILSIINNRKNEV